MPYTDFLQLTLSGNDNATTYSVSAAKINIVRTIVSFLVIYIEL